MSQKVVTIAVYENSLDARVARLWLENHGINAAITGEALNIAVPEIGWPRIELQVLEKDVHEAKRLLEEQRNQQFDQENEGDQ